MRELRTEIEIAAAPGKVWSVLMDIDKWKEWNPIIDQISGVVSPGSKLSITMTGGMKYTAMVTTIEEPTSFQWRAVMMTGFLFTNIKVFELQEIDSGTRLIHREEYSGMLMSIFWSKLNKKALPMLESMNKALKIEAEKENE